MPVLLVLAQLGSVFIENAAVNVKKAHKSIKIQNANISFLACIVLVL